MPDLTRLITATDPAVRNQALDAACAELSLAQLLEQCAELDSFRRRSENLYERVRALFFLYAIHRFHLPPKLAHGTRNTKHETRNPASATPIADHLSRFTSDASRSLIPFHGYEHLLQRRF